MSEAKIEPFDIDSPYLEAAVDVYIETWGHPRESSLEFVRRYAEYPDFRGLVALEDGKVVGMGFGVRSFKGNWWTDKVTAELGAAHPALRSAWTLVELAVRPHARGRGLGTVLHDGLLAAQPLPRALLSTGRDNQGARRLYERLGWRYLHRNFVFEEGGRPFVIMHRERCHEKP